MVRKLRSQPRIKGLKRVPTHASVHPQVDAEISRLSRQYGVSKSWVRATLESEALGFKGQVSYEEAKSLFKK